jgi:hypothetical protein
MADYTGVKCDQCPAHTSEPQDWLVAIEHPGLDGILYEALESVACELRPEYTVRHLCCEQCARIDFNLWLDRRKRIDLRRKDQPA